MAAKVPVTVTLKPGAKPPVTMKPDPVDVYHSGDTVEWVPHANSKFIFVALIFEDENPFSDVVVQTTRITALDNYQSADKYQYRILVKDEQGNYYSSDAGIETADGGPTIRNN
jgi:hypothetical protein